ncbi:MAG: cache domain-containing protein [Deltaproteobacteria bacterium]|nr:cache domain-containing protein [Deltaproteobacteria bacterium]
MKRNRCLATLLGVFVAAMVVGVPSSWAETAIEKVTKYANTKLIPMAAEKIFVDAVKAENAKNKTLDQIMRIDDKWQSVSGTDDFIRAMLANPVSKHLMAIRDKYPFLREMFLVDNQGANIAVSEKTSDYWQGDEAKFKKAFDKGVGSVFVDDVKFDRSTKSFLAHVSVPVLEGDTALGVLIFGVDMDKFWLIPADQLK